MTKKELYDRIYSVKEVEHLRSHRRAQGRSVYNAFLLVRIVSQGIFVCGVVPAHFLFYRRCLIIASFNKNDKEHLVNEEILSGGTNEKSQIRVIGPEGEQMGLMTVGSALESAYDKDLDLVLISPASTPPVCRILDYGKFRFDREKRKKEAKKNQTKVDVKEIQLSCHIDTNDFNTKANNAKRFLQSGNKVKVLVIFKGRQMAHQEVGKQLLERFREYVAEVGSVDKAPMMEGRSMTMIISPVKQSAAKPAQPKPEQE